MPWKDLFAPAIKIADEGFKMDQKIYVIASNFPYLSKSENFAKLYLQENGKPKAVGTIIKNPELAEKLEIRSIPTFIFYEKGKEISRKSGMVSKNFLIESLS